MIFWSKLNEYKQLIAMPIIIPNKNDLNLINLQSDNISSPETFNSERDYEINYNELASPSTSSQTSAESTINLTDDDTTNIVKSFEASLKRPMAFRGPEMLKKACRNVYNLNLKQFLEKTVSGKYILTAYQNQKKLTKALRSQLSYILISGVMSDTRENLIPLDFEMLCDKICELFPSETRSTYYIPRIPGNKHLKPINPKGKLIDKYRNLKKLYSDSNSKEKVEEVVNEASSASEDNHGNEDDLKESAGWLKLYVEPWDLVLQHWNKSFILRKTAKSPTVAEFIGEWPILKHQNAYMLVNLDFQKLYPQCSISSLINEYMKWEKFFEILMNTTVLDKPSREFC
ncbi:hypothetical protein PPYR_02389 [Photinus pyralis]|uniref:Uncharacterized protein n=2 Tax=Photinus pyralis TaxID=7054 RepID=A0A5N4B740_PHOPY|nr:hypothetical protein PPYR_02389 [Photinus pyralis]